MLVIDSEPIRRSARRDYEKAVRDLEKAKLEAERFHAEDQPLYMRWLNSTFGAILTENRRLQEKVYEAQGIVSEVQQEFYYGQHRSIYSAYLIVMRRRSHPEEFEEERKAVNEEEEAFRKAFEGIFGEGSAHRGDDGSQAHFDGLAPSEPRPAAKPGSSRLKELYRSVVRKLHPDTAGQRNARQMEWWHQAQAAYEAGDADQLEVILTMAEVDEQGTKNATVGVLQQITAQFKQGLSSLRRELRRYRRDAAWNFSRVNDLEPLRARTRELLEAERAQLSLMLQQFQQQIENWEALGRRLATRSGGSSGKSRPRARRAAEADPWF